MPRLLIVDDNKELLKLVSSVFEARGYEVVQAQRARAALDAAARGGIDAAIVDVLLPDQMGYDVAAFLRGRNVPFVLMSGVFKGGRHALDAVQKHGALEYFEKPFDTEKLAATVASMAPPPAGARPAAEAARVARAPGDAGARPSDVARPSDLTGRHGTITGRQSTLSGRIAPAVEFTGRHAPAEGEPEAFEPAPVEIELDLEGDEQMLELTGRVSVVQGPGKVAATLTGDTLRVRAGVAAPPHPAAAAVPPPVRPAAATPAAGSRSAAAPPVPVAAAAPAAGAAATPAPEATSRQSRSGRLEDNLPQLISAFYLASESGELEMQRGQVRKTVLFDGGMPVFAASNLVTDRFGEFLVRLGKVPAEDIKAAARVAEKSGRRAGDILVEMGLLTESERMYYVGQQVKAIIYSLFAWEDGTWRISFQRRARGEVLKLDLHPANLIMRGVKKLYSPARLERLMPDHARPIPAPDPSYPLSDVELEGWEAVLLSRVDGTRDVSALVKLANRPAEQVRGLLVGLLSLRVVQFA